MKNNGSKNFNKNYLLIIGVSIGAVAILTPFVYDFLERTAVVNLKIQFNHIELSNIDITGTQSFGSIQQIVNNLQNPSIESLINMQSLASTFPNEYLLEADLVANTKYTFNVYLDVNNPSSMPVVLDRATIKTYIEGHELSGEITLPKKITISPWASQSVVLQGITISGKDIASIIANLPSRDFNLYFFFDITSYYPTIFSEVPVPIKIDLKAYPIPQKPDIDNFYQAVANQDSYTLSIKNNHDTALSGTLSVGALRGDPLIGCDPGCIAPIDNGLATFLRIKGASLFNIETHQFAENIDSGQSKEINVSPNLRSNANSALILMWDPNQSTTIPYTVTVDVAGVKTNHQGKFESPELAKVGSLIYYLVRDFGYVGNEKFVSVYVLETSNIQYNPPPNSNNGQSVGSQVGQIIQGITGAISRAIQPYIPPAQTISIYPDKNSYNFEDTITILGTVNPVSPDKIVTLQYLNPNGQTITISQPTPYSDGSFSASMPFRNPTLISGTYTVIATYGSSQSQTTFYFNAASATPQNSGGDISITPGAGATANAYCVSTNSCFSPNPIDITLGTTITWTNNDQQSHTITSGHASDNDVGSSFSSGLIKPGDSFQLHFTYSGTYDYFCSVHPWMAGQVNVQ